MRVAATSTRSVPPPTAGPTPARGFHVIDYPDGRYLVRHNDNALRADPADSQLLRSHLQGCLDATIGDFRTDNDPNYSYG